MAGAANQVELQGRLIEMDVLRHTPAGLPVLKFRLGHESIQAEAGGERKVSCEVEAVAFEREARLLASATLGMGLKLRGFMDRKSRSSQKLVLHATQIEFVELEPPGENAADSAEQKI